ncbi:hypothetical protein [Nonlabens marinus]|uniref:Uncharacterized protein n=1 Tax=Nonlabens marinus S1-08 TaxID=1454201 RepID=W8VVZ1_9FLAO|nr:hypothetical protein [Nonlabens marinus]BAO54292.1 hypothetical protein NMS_0283 [Nonlabens marinus S1-08]
MQNGDFKNVSFEPNMQFVTVMDSAYQYFSKEDYKMVLAGSVARGETIYQSDKFSLKILLRTYNLVDREEYEFVLRTFSKDFKIIDSYVMSSTLNNLSCDGSIDNDLVITKTCDDGTSKTATIDEYGKFIVE